MLVDFKEHGARAKAEKPAQMKVEERPADGAAAPGRIDRDRKNLRFARCKPRQDETGCATFDVGEMADHRFVEEEPVNFVLAPAALERDAV